MAACCKILCNNRIGFRDVWDSFNILTTWILPLLALLSCLPYESAKDGKWRKSFLSVVNWIGSPQTALTSTLFNIHMTYRCLRRSENIDAGRQYRAAYYVLSCLNQYEYPTLYINGVVSHELQDRRNQVLLFGLFRPLSGSRSSSTRASTTSPLSPIDQKELTGDLLLELAYQLRVLRRRGVYPILITVVWFLLAFCLSLVFAFGNLGDNSTAHSLALGLILIWLPVLVTAAAVDRKT